MLLSIFFVFWAQNQHSSIIFSNDWIRSVHVLRYIELSLVAIIITIARFLPHCVCIISNNSEYDHGDCNDWNVYLIKVFLLSISLLMEYVLLIITIAMFLQLRFSFSILLFLYQIILPFCIVSFQHLLLFLVSLYFYR